MKREVSILTGVLSNLDGALGLELHLKVFPHFLSKSFAQILAVHRIGNVRGEEARLRAAVVALALELEAVERL